MICIKIEISLSVADKEDLEKNKGGPSYAGTKRHPRWQGPIRPWIQKISGIEIAAILEVN
jgi:hypothetical protein